MGNKFGHECSDCDFFVFDLGDVGYCLKNPPIILMPTTVKEYNEEQTLGVFPRVNHWDWCGSFEPEKPNE